MVAFGKSNTVLMRD